MPDIIPTGSPEVTVNGRRGKNPNYMCRIDSTAGISITADMPEQMIYTISNTWEPRFSAGLNEIIGAFDFGARLIGENILVQEFTQLMWMNTTPIEIPLTLMFDAQKSALEDVVKPMQALELLALPDLQGSFLTAPGPSVVNPNRNKTTIFVGRAWYFESVVITSVANSYDIRLDHSGYPIAGQSEVSFSTTKVYGRSDWLAAQGRI